MGSGGISLLCFSEEGSESAFIGSGGSRTGRVGSRNEKSGR
jgi:hypothetical protein